MAIKFDFNDELLTNLETFDEKLMIACQMYAQTQSDVLVAHMKSNRPWTDRTNQAKATLRGQVSKVGNHIVRITLSHGVEYGLWLELANEKRFAIIYPTIKNRGGEVINGLKKIFSLVKF